VATTTLTFIVFIFTTLIFGFFLYYYAWHNRHATQMRLAINNIDGRVISIKKEIKKNRGNQTPPDLFVIKSVAWKVVYKDRNDKLCEKHCSLKDGQLDWQPPLS